MFSPLEVILTFRVLGTLLVFSITDLISHACEYLLGCFFSNTYTWLLAILSCAISTFSVPLMMK